MYRHRKEHNIYYPPPCISLFYSFVCSSHLCILSYMHVPYGAFFINKEFELELVNIFVSKIYVDCKKKQKKTCFVIVRDSSVV